MMPVLEAIPLPSFECLACDVCLRDHCGYQAGRRARKFPPKLPFPSVLTVLRSACHQTELSGGRGDFLTELIFF